MKKKTFSSSFDEIQNRILRRFDELIREIKAWREFDILLDQIVDRHEKIIGIHKIRIARLGKHQQIHE